MKPLTTLYFVSALLSSALQESGAAASQGFLRDSNGGEKEGAANSGLLDRDLRLASKPGDGEISKELPMYDDASKKMLCIKKCPRGDLAVSLKNECVCLKPCSKVCRSFSIRCTGEGEYGEGTFWETAENMRCYQWERWQNKFPLGPFPVSRRFLRTTCKCPRRNFSVSAACSPATQANLSNCIKGEITNSGEYEINFGHLTNVQLGKVLATGNYLEGGDLKGYDIDFQGDVSGSHFCELESEQGDLEFGGEACPITFSTNSVMSVKVTKVPNVKGGDFKFEEGAWVNNNHFGDIDAGDDFQFNGSTEAIRTTEIVDNSFADIVIGDKCNYNDGQDETDIDASGNSCNTFAVGDPSDCSPTVFGGFDCV